MFEMDFQWSRVAGPLPSEPVACPPRRHYFRCPADPRVPYHLFLSMVWYFPPTCHLSDFIPQTGPKAASEGHAEVATYVKLSVSSACPYAILKPILSSLSAYRLFLPLHSSAPRRSYQSKHRTFGRFLKDCDIARYGTCGVVVSLSWYLRQSIRPGSLMLLLPQPLPVLSKFGLLDHG